MLLFCRFQCADDFRLHVCFDKFDFAFELDKDKDTTIRKYKPDAMCNKNVAMIHVVVLSIFIALIFSCACSLRLCLGAGQRQGHYNPTLLSLHGGNVQPVRCHDLCCCFVDFQCRSFPFNGISTKGLSVEICGQAPCQAG
jgi:hypothetical protein